MAESLKYGQHRTGRLQSESIQSCKCILVYCNFVLSCCRWLDVKEDDGLTVREITATGTQMLASN